jgi:peptidoglycan/xylan/chitin deacetylase (PgdA/CDA1 family)
MLQPLIQCPFMIGLWSLQGRVFEMIVVCLHNIIKTQPDRFDQKCSRLSQDEFEKFILETQKHFSLISFSEYLRRQEAKEFSPHTVTLTFDDGFLGVLKYAAPILKKYNLDAAVFVNPPYTQKTEPKYFHFLEIEIAFRLSKVDSLSLPFLPGPLEIKSDDAKVKAMKTVKRKLKETPEAERKIGHELLLQELKVSKTEIQSYADADEKFQTMNPDEIKSLIKEGWTIGSHTMTHRSIGQLNEAELFIELDDSKKAVESLWGLDEVTLAYPYGEVVHVGTQAPVLARKLGYKMAFSTVTGVNEASTDTMMLKRIDYKVFVRDRLIEAKF